MPKLIRVLVKLVLVGLLLYVGVCAFFYTQQRSLLYFPQPAQGTVDRFTLESGGEHLQVSVVGPADAPEAVLYFGGNAEDVSLSATDWAAWLPSARIYLLHYRGFGGSTGEPSEVALHADAMALYDRVRSHHGTISVAGRSLGSGVAVRLASSQPVRRLLLITPYDSIAAVASHHYGFLPVDWLLKDRFDSGQVAPTIRVPTTVVLAEKDQVIPPARTERLVSRFAPDTARLVIVNGAGHSDVQLFPAFVSAVHAALLP